MTDNLLEQAKFATENTALQFESIKRRKIFSRQKVIEIILDLMHPDTNKSSLANTFEYLGVIIDTYKAGEYGVGRSGETLNQIQALFDLDLKDIITRFGQPEFNSLLIQKAKNLKSDMSFAHIVSEHLTEL